MSWCLITWSWERLEEYGKPELGGQAGGKQPTGPDGHWLEPITTLGVLAGITSRVRLGTNILEAALRRPVVLAKELATLDVLSGGRVDLGVGVGWQREEYEAAGLSFERRGRLLDHSLEVCTLLWRERRADYHSSELDFDAIHQMPKPLQEGGIPVWVSGTINQRTVSRLARFGQGWIPWGMEAADVSSIGRMKDALESVGRDPSDLRVVWYLPLAMGDAMIQDLSAMGERMAPMIDAGVTDFNWAPSEAEGVAETEETFHAIVSEFRKAVGRSQN